MPLRDAGPSGVLLLDKPAGVTSTRALAVAKRLMGSRKAGHTGTLDPFATGLLPLAFGEATKFSRFLLDASKCYLATLVLGQISTTGDPEGDLSEKVIFDVDRLQIEEVIDSLRGVQEQVPPMYSALHHEGRRLYELAREGIEVPRAPRSVVIHELEVVDISREKLVISVNCSKGTYVRVLAEEIGRRLGSGAYLTALRRTKVGRFLLEEATTLEALDALGPIDALTRLQPPERFVDDLARIHLEAASADAFAQGQRVNCLGTQGEIAAFRDGGRFLGVGRRDGAGGLCAVRLMATASRADSPDFA